jgi:hypothetical protein
VAVPGKRLLAVTGELALPFADAVGVQLMFAGNLGDGLARFDFKQHLLLELASELPTFETHSRGSLSVRIPR